MCNHDRAEPLVREALPSVHGPMQPQVAIAKCNLASLLYVPNAKGVAQNIPGSHNVHWVTGIQTATNSTGILPNPGRVGRCGADEATV